MNAHFVEIAAIQDSLEAAIVEVSLKRRKVLFRIWENTDTLFGGLFVKSRGWGTILAPEECREIIVATILDYRESLRK